MRALLVFIAALFIVGGAVIIARPKATVVSHQAYRYKASSAEVVPEDQSVAYGVVSLGFGAVSLLAAMTWKKWYTSERT